MRAHNRNAGFTLIELLVVLAIIGTLLALAAPRYIGSVEKAREAALRENLATMRDVIDKFYGDTGKYPASLNDLVTQRYLRKIPVDPMTESNQSWISLAPEDGGQGAVFDVRSGSQGRARDGTFYKDW
ncbi:type II secretion system protein [Herbaspirillum huttiense]|uniref:type II secretion system protein n=1 Tax=Herbaspirillum huttiense TaxID=863372 RepID=UPI0021769CD8|nr:prepilin-type N-terminal cleavage/methylation domain-containing protein [Herbaspirillum huttiense]UWE14524.1 prepilin-type N-terminal cleavage/methylation domain-containing protein [Herbaspirillum huttiense]